MKNLKLIYSLLVALVAGLFGACTNDPYTPGEVPAGPQVSFSIENATVFNITGEEADDVQKVILTRIVTDKSLEVPILVTFGDPNAEDGTEEPYDNTLFNVPKVVTFAAGEDVAELAITADSKRMEEGKEYKMRLLLADDSQATPYGEQKWDVAFRLFPWNRLKGEFSDYGKICGGDFFTGLENLFSVLSFKSDVEVEIYTHKTYYNEKTKAGRYLVYNPWDKVSASALGTAVAEEDTTKAKHLVINCEDPDKCYIEEQVTGLEKGESEWCIESVYHPTKNPTGVAGVLEDGVITWPTNSLYISSPGYKNNYKFVTNINGMFRITLPDGVPTDYSLSVKYDGMDASSDYESVKATFVFTHGTDITGIKYYFAEGNVLANPTAAIEALINGTATDIYEVADFATGSEKTEINVDIANAGVYTIVAAPKNKDGELVEKQVALDSFYYSGNISVGSNPCDITVTFTKYSESFTDEAGDDIGDYNAFGYTFKGTDLKSASIYCWPTTVVEEYFKNNGGATTEADKISLYKSLFNEEGVVPFTLDELTEIQSAEGKKNFYGELEDNTNYTAVVFATNNYEQKAIKEYTFKTDVAPVYAGELVEGKFTMKSKAALASYETTFDIKSYQGSSKKFLVTNLCLENGAEFFATYDANAGTLTLDGTVHGRKKEGNLFGKLFDYIEDSGKDKLCYQYESQLEQGDLNLSSVVFNIDKESKQPIGLQNYRLKIQVYKVKQDRDGNDIAGTAVLDHKSNMEFNNKSTTTITPYVAPQTPGTGESGYAEN